MAEMQAKSQLFATVNLLDEWKGLWGTKNVDLKWLRSKNYFDLIQY